jgi:hypothetical protein
VIDPDQPTRSAITLAGMSGSVSNNARTRCSNTVNDVGCGRRSYFGGASDATAFSTVVREIAKRFAICAFGTPSASRLRINAQSSKVITLQSSSVHFSPSTPTSFRASSTAWPGDYLGRDAEQSVRRVGPSAEANQYVGRP